MCLSGWCRPHSWESTFPISFKLHRNQPKHWTKVRPCESDQRFTTSSHRTLDLFEMGSACMHTLAESPRGLGRGSPPVFESCVFSVLKDAKLYTWKQLSGGIPGPMSWEMHLEDTDTHPYFFLPLVLKDISICFNTKVVVKIAHI